MLFGTGLGHQTQSLLMRFRGFVIRNRVKIEMWIMVSIFFLRSSCLCTIHQIWQISLLPYLIQSLSYTKFGCCQPPLLLEYSKKAIIIGYPPKITLFHSQIVYFYKLNYRFTLYQQCKFYIVNVHIYLIHNMNLELEKLQSSLVDHVILSIIPLKNFHLFKIAGSVINFCLKNFSN